MENYRYVRRIGRGSYGQVWLVRSKKDKKQYVLKQIKIENVSKRELRTANLEVQLLATLRHPNIVSYKDSFETSDGFLCIAMGYCEGGDLYAKIKEQNGVLFDEKQIVQWFIQICMALQYLHERKILHRDLKTKNIFLTKRNIVKVGDLGIAKVLECDSAMATTLIGTPYYMSPELFSNRPYNFKSDIWALGCCIYELATLKHAFDARDMNSLMYKIVRGKLPKMPCQYSSMLRDLIIKMLSHDPAERPSVSRILRNQFVRKNIEIFLAGTRLMKLEAKDKLLVSTPRVVTSVSKCDESQLEQIESVNLSVNGIGLLNDLSKESIDVEESGVFCDVDERYKKGTANLNSVDLPAINSKPDSTTSMSSKNKRQSSKTSNMDAISSKDVVLCVDGQEIILEEKMTERGCSDNSSIPYRNNPQSEHEPRFLCLRRLKQLEDGGCLPLDSAIKSVVVIPNLPPLAVKNATTLNHQIQAPFDPMCLPPQLGSKHCNQRTKHKQSSRRKALPPLLSAVTHNSGGSAVLTDQRPPNNTARQRRRQKQLKEDSRVPTHASDIQDGQNGGNTSRATTDIHNDLEINCLIDLLNTNLKRDPESAPPFGTPVSSPKKCCRSLSLSNLEDADVTKVRSLSRLEQRIWYLERDCIRGLGRDLLERVLELLDKDSSKLKMVLSNKKYGNFIAKLFQLKLCRDSLKNLPQL